MSEAGGSESGGGFTPKPELMSALLSMGVSQNAAAKGLYYTGNHNAELAAAWIFENQDKNIDAPLGCEDSSDDDGANFADERDLQKMVLIVNAELNMGVGKIGAQCGHAAVGLYKFCMENESKFGEMLLKWEMLGETKIVLKGTSTSHLLELAAKASTLDLPTYLVQDAGKTEVAAGSTTVLAILGQISRVNQVSGSLKLL